MGRLAKTSLITSGRPAEQKAKSSSAALNRLTRLWTMFCDAPWLANRAGTKICALSNFILMMWEDIEDDYSLLLGLWSRMRFACCFLIRTSGARAQYIYPLPVTFLGLLDPPKTLEMTCLTPSDHIFKVGAQSRQGGCIVSHLDIIPRICRRTRPLWGQHTSLFLLPCSLHSTDCGYGVHDDDCMLR